jgi:hypothetical protein
MQSSQQSFMRGARAAKATQRRRKLWCDLETVVRYGTQHRLLSLRGTRQPAEANLKLSIKNVDRGSWDHLTADATRGAMNGPGRNGFVYSPFACMGARDPSRPSDLALVVCTSWFDLGIEPGIGARDANVFAIGMSLSFMAALITTAA